MSRRQEVLVLGDLKAEHAEWYREYPRKKAPADSLRAYIRARREASQAELLAALRKFVFSDNPKYIPYPATWLNKQRWLDEPDEPVRSKMEDALRGTEFERFYPSSPADEAPMIEGTIL